MYFESRSSAGQILALQLAPKYLNENCAVVALSDDSVEVGEQIAMTLHCPLTLLLIEEIEVPGEDMKFGGVSQNGNFTYNASFSSGEIEGYVGEYHGYLEEEKRKAFQAINRLIGEGGSSSHELLNDKNIILVADGLSSGIALDVAVDFLKPVRVKRLIVAAPVASVEAVDKLHILADELHILDVKENYMETDHYYEQNTSLSHDEVVEKINTIMTNLSA